MVRFSLGSQVVSGFSKRFRIDIVLSGSSLLHIAALGVVLACHLNYEDSSACGLWDWLLVCGGNGF